ncbi:hypothetical protein F4678DRAFT_428755 [Xylaria arbuscula]|nr:hypothetical protein F4678DRAFT_428755 [Xylaria arbuscula]
MRDATQRDPTQRQCRDKLDRLWNNWAIEGYTDIRLQGSASISIEDCKRERIRQICAELKASPFDNKTPSSLTQSQGSSPLSSARSSPSVPDLYTYLEWHEHDSKYLVPDETPPFAKLDACSELALSAENSQESTSNYVSRSIGVQSSDTFTDHLRTVALLSEELDRNAELLRQKETRLTAQQHQIYHLKSDLDTTRTEYENLVRAIDRQGESVHNAQVVHSLRNANSALKRQLEDIRAAQINTERVAEPESLCPTNSEIRAELDWLEDRLAKTCSAFGYLSSVVQPLSDEPVRLRRLIERVSGKSIQQFNTYISSARISDYQLARALSAAMICELAFETSFPESLGSESLLLHGYREQISLQAGFSSLRSLDLLAHQSILSDPFFVERLVPEKSRDLALETFQLLTQWNPSENKSQHPSHAARIPKNELFQPVLTKALNLKARLLLSRSRYTFVFPAVGTEFDPTTMQRHRYDQRSSSVQTVPDDPLIQAEPKVKLVKLCLFPALYAYPMTADKEVLRSTKADLGGHLVDYHNFVVANGESITGEAVMVSKGVVQM